MQDSEGFEARILHPKYGELLARNGDAMRDPDRTSEMCRAHHRPTYRGRRGPTLPTRLQMRPPVRPEGWGWAFDAATPDRRRSDRAAVAGPERGGDDRRRSDRTAAAGLERRADDRRRAEDRRSGVDRRSGADRRSLMSHAREFATRFREPLIGLGVAAASMPLIRASAPHAAHEPEAPTDRTPASPAAAAAATRAAQPDRDVDAEVGAHWSNVDRSNTIQSAVDSYDISPELASQIYDHATDAGVDPKLAYGLVKTESDFRNTAVSNVGARGLTQLMPATARWLKPGTRPADLFEPKTSLQVGFKYLRQLIDRYDGNRHLALTAYNRGPGTVERAIKRGRDPDNGYAGTVLRNALRGKAARTGVKPGADQQPG